MVGVFLPHLPQPIWAYLKTRGAYLPPLYIQGLVWVIVPNHFVNNLSRNDLPYSKGFMKFGWLEPPTKKNDYYNFSLVREASDPIPSIPSNPSGIYIYIALNELNRPNIDLSRQEYTNCILEDVLAIISWSSASSFVIANINRVEHWSREIVTLI